MSNASRRSRRPAEPPVQPVPDATNPAPIAATAELSDPASPPSDGVGGADGASEGGNAPEGGAGSEGDAGETSQGFAEGEMGARPPLAPLVEAQLQAQTRETLIGTIEEWAGAGAQEIGRVFDLIGEHDYSAEELETFRAAFDGLRLEALTHVELLDAQRDALRIERLDEGLKLLGLDPSSILSISKDFRRVVTTDGRKVELA